MADQFSFDDEYAESEVDTLQGAPPNPLAALSQNKRAAYAANRLMLGPDGVPIPQEVPAQLRLNQQAARPMRPAQAQPEEYEETEEVAMDQVLGTYEREQRSIQQTISEAEKRFDKARYYKLLLEHKLFDNSTSAGQEVADELKAWAQERFEVFLGMRQERGAMPAIFEGWEPGDFETLLALVRRIRQKPDLATQVAPRAEPTLNPVRPQQSPQAPARASEPALRPIHGQPTPQAAPQPVQQRRPVPPTGPRKRRVKPLVDPMTGKVKINPETGKAFIKDVTPQVRPAEGTPQPVPMPMGRAAIEQIHQQKASEAAANLENRLSRAGEMGMKLRIASAHAQVTGVDGDTVYDGQMYTPDPSMMVSTPAEARGIATIVNERQ